MALWDHGAREAHGTTGPYFPNLSVVPTGYHLLLWAQNRNSRMAGTKPFRDTVSTRPQEHWFKVEASCEGWLDTKRNKCHTASF